MRLSVKSLRRGSRKQRTCTLGLSRQEPREGLGAIFEAKRLEDYLPDKRDSECRIAKKDECFKGMGLVRV